MARPKTRHPEAKQLSAWLSPAAFRVLDGWKAAKGYTSRAETLEAILGAVGRKLDRERWAKRDEGIEEGRDDLADDAPDREPGYVPRTASGIEIDPDCPEMAALEDC